MSMRHRPDQAGGWRPSLGLLAIALGLVLTAGAWWWMGAPDAAAEPLAAAAPAGSAAAPLAPTPDGVPTAAVVAVVAASNVAATPPAQYGAPPPRIPRQRDPNGDLTPDLADYVNEGERPGMAEVIARLHQAGVYTGLGAFSPPGTRPPLLGLAVPEDFPLPAGYVRHHQATDDGQRIEAILMFAPDAQLVDAARQPIAMPADRVVPPELAPPGLPLRRIVVPAPLERPGG
ncbi:hypothetical protein PFX98_00360 [Paucibacter sediminis]|uniref:Uncharacterized protein n=1 Tax=Paucibacter sediminis TaxID=3019553 RepID=A0AA95NGV9_9BURK|nr:hypothetical protein [Paucibacter sp. S2-9]WIT12089.1 hypothetical protein PFX98_00360 [Paucibacter sp. S2-9]